jgi:hypothetical protein
MPPDVGREGKEVKEVKEGREVPAIARDGLLPFLGGPSFSSDI